MKHRQSVFLGVGGIYYTCTRIHAKNITIFLFMSILLTSLLSRTPTRNNNNNIIIMLTSSLSTSIPLKKQHHKGETTELMSSRIICSKCWGEGKIRSRLTKKAKLQRLKNNNQQLSNSNNNDEKKEILPKITQVSMKPCNSCFGSGLVKNQNQQSISITSNINPNIHVGIIGGGIGGLALALALQHRSIPFTIYEKDCNFEERKQGYGLTMQQGGQALLALGLFDEEDGDDNVDDKNNIGIGVKDDKEYSSNNGNKKNNQQNKRKQLLFGKGIHSKRHLVHEPNGDIIGEWGLNVWGRPKSKEGRDAKRQNAHIQRQELRRILFDQIVDKENRIKWGHKFVKYSEGIDDYRSISMTFEKRDDCRNGVDLGNDSVVNYTSTVLVGADGIHSIVRSQKIGEHKSPLRYLGCIVILGITSSPQSSSLTSDGETVFQTADGTTRMYAMPFARKGMETAGAAQFSNIQREVNPEILESKVTKEGDGETMWQLSFPMSERDAILLSKKGPSELKKEAIIRCNSWHSPIPEMLETTPDELISGYPVYDREIVSNELFRHGDKNDSKCFSDRVTMIGDAAHPMSPFKGQGANQALLDAVLLARSLFNICRQLRHQDSTDNSPRQISEQGNTILTEGLHDFESNMLKRSESKVRASADAARHLHSNIAITKGNITRAAAIKRALDGSI